MKYRTGSGKQENLLANSPTSAHRTTAMKIVKELPLYLFNRIKLSFIPKSKLVNLSKEKLPVIISFTSIESRLASVHLVVRSLLTQTQLPEKIILWLNRELESQVPKSLSRLESELFEIRYSDLHSSHKKLIHSLEAFPHHVIITCDDDLMYRKNWLYMLYQCHLDSPKHIIGNTTLHINYHNEGQVMPSKQWRYPDAQEVNPKAIVAIGAWGILYPPGSLHPSVRDAELFMQIARYSDDFWFKAMALLQGTITSQAPNTPKEPIPIAGTQKVSLKHLNLGRKKNDEQWEALATHFNLNAIVQSDKPLYKFSKNSAIDC